MALKNKVYRLCYSALEYLLKTDMIRRWIINKLSKVAGKNIDTIGRTIKIAGLSDINSDLPTWVKDNKNSIFILTTYHDYKINSVERRS